MSKVLSWEDRQTRELEFVQKYVENGGNATEAAKAVGVSNNSASTVGHRLKTGSAMRLSPNNLHPFLVTPLRPSVILNFWRNRLNQNRYDWVLSKISWTEPDLNRSTGKRYTKCQSSQDGRTKNSTPNTNE